MESLLITATNSLSGQILQLVLEHANFSEDIQKADSTSVRSFLDSHQTTIQEAIRANAPIHFILPAFPAKSPNPEKTFNHLPDYGEVLALKKLNDLCEEINALYAHGALVTICSDGRVFSDLVEVSDVNVNEYTQQIRKIIDENHFRHLFTFCLEDVFVEAKHFHEMRALLVKNYAAPTETLRFRAKTENTFQYFFNGIHRFLFEDQLVLHPDQSRNQSRERAKSLSYLVIQRSDAWSTLLEDSFPEAIRLSIHPQPLLSKKIGFRLLDSSDIWRTPWHSVPLFDGQNFRLVSRKKAEELGAEIRYMNQKYPYYAFAEKSIQTDVSHA